ncbi:hypothetical protein DPMN_063297 [Dreissena polymorpha]|uniref:Uncharacterized protein n=1 Tax=Dreissena polymorpha TaxID=45954 RepID=A0A9D4CA88_DREPO|nr:hypothetical protein DPMN_063297 [Dreissena polymorpha]
MHHSVGQSVAAISSDEKLKYLLEKKAQCYTTHFLQENKVFGTYIVPPLVYCDKTSRSEESH